MENIELSMLRMKMKYPGRRDLLQDTTTNKKESKTNILSQRILIYQSILSLGWTDSDKEAVQKAPTAEKLQEASRDLHMYHFLSSDPQGLNDDGLKI